jgi:hypothetical protein
MRGPAASLAMSAMPLKAEVSSEHLRFCGQLLRLDGIAMDVIQALGRDGTDDGKSSNRTIIYK